MTTHSGCHNSTAFFSLGLISTTVEGCDILEDYGWTPTISSIGHMTGICLPDDLKDFTEVSRIPASQRRMQAQYVHRSAASLGALSAWTTLTSTRFECTT